MKLTKKLEAEILEVYKTYWDAFLRGDIKSIASLVDDNCHVIGSSVGEVFNDKRSLLKYLKATIGQIKEKAELRSRKISVTAEGKDIMVNDQSDLYILLDDTWTFYGHGRASTLFSKKANKWKIIHLHRSLPDSKAGEGEQVNTEKIKAENLQLRDAVKRRTKELENKNRELEIEAAVERVRAKALAMHRSEDIHEVVRTLRNELFGLNLEGIMGATICLKQTDGQVRLWDITDIENTGRYGWDILFNMKEIDPRLWVKKIWNSKKQIISAEQDSNDLKRALKWLGQYDKRTADEILKLLKINKIKHGWHRAVKLANGILITDFANEPPAEIESILLKISAAFNLAYKRFLDLQKAEAQARDAQIEAALERVRSRTMAMHKSEEVTGIAVALNEELLKLGFEGGSTIIIIDKETGDTEQWTGFSADKTLQSCYVPNFKHPYHNALLDGWKRGENFLVYTVTGKEKKTLDEHYFTTGYKDFPESDKKWMRQMASVTFSHAFMKYGAIHWGPDHLTEEQLRILQRFSKVFEQSYTRFLDLQKAEVQTREATIETSLERVRASSMAMHNSNDLLSVVNLLGEQLRQLGFQADAVSFITDGDENGYNMWLSSPGDSFLSKIYVPRINDRTTMLYNEAKEQGRDFYSYILTKEEKDFYFKNFFENTILKNYPHEGKQAVYDAPGMATTNVILEKIVLSISNFSAIPYTEQDNIIIKRFAFVFQQSYTRFLDLQKAEAQAREAQVELALERVRARTMAMQKSDELREAVLVIYQQLEELDFGALACNIIIIDKDTGDEQFWVSGFTQEIYPESYHVPRLNHHYQDDQFTAWRNGLKYAVFEYTGREKKKFDKIFFTETDFRNVPEQAKQFMIGLESVKLSTAFTTYGSLQIIGPDPLSEEKANILKRFAKVFEQTYTRFLDLQKAEAQAREAQIEAALERVRSRSMAMHKSDDLHEVIKVVIEQLSLLSVKFNVANFAKIDPDGSWDLWLSTPDQTYPALIHVPYLDHPIFNDITEQVAKKNDFHTNVYNQEETTIFFHHFFENTIAKNTPEERKQFVYSSKGLSRSLFLTKNIWFSVSRYDATPFTDEENAIFKRFANVFEQTYTRFLDLQKAEAQAREAQIEAALERVRARAMAMHKSSELKDVARELRTQLGLLGTKELETCAINLYGESSEFIHALAATRLPSSQEEITESDFLFPKKGITIIEEILQAYSSGVEECVILNEGAKSTQWMNVLAKALPDVFAIVAESTGFNKNAEIRVWWTCAFFQDGSLIMITMSPPDDTSRSLLKRFALVFGMAYRRFADLKKAEAQAREAQIEVSLERVRSRAMAMQSSDELRELIGTVFSELTKLDIVLTRCLIMIYDPRSNDSIWWMANSEAPTEPIGLRIQNHAHSPYIAYLRAWEEKKLKWVYVLEGAVKKDWDDFLFVETELSLLPDFVIAGMKAPERVYLNSSFNSFGNLTLASLEPLSNEHFDILLRFAKVFDLTYTRFNDLQKAEAQAREAQIELALERVRARTMAMHKSEELAETAQVLFQQLSELGGIPDRIAIGIADEVNGVVNFWTTDQQGSHLDHSFSARLNERTTIAKTYQAWKEQKKSLVVDLHGEELQEWIQFAREEMGIVVKGDQIKDRRVHTMAFFSHGWILVTSHEPQSAETAQILERFASVFNLTYRRFLDLKKAEAQAREAQIELSLERIRAKTMAMHQSEELVDTSVILFQELKSLGLNAIRTGVAIIDDKNETMELWSSQLIEQKQNKVLGVVPMDAHPFFTNLLLAWRKKDKDFSYEMKDDEVKIYYETMSSFLSYPPQKTYNPREIFNPFFFPEGSLTVVSHQPLSIEERSIMQRFAGVFGLLYRRFLDLQMAEAQANEARIEIALERIRARALAMHKSDELIEVAKVLWEQMTLLGQRELEASAVHLYEQDPNHIHSWRAVSIGPDANPELTYGHMAIPKNSCELVREWLEKFYSNSTEYTIELIGTKQEEWYDLLFKLAPDVANSMRQKDDVHEKRYYRFSKFSGGALLMISKQEPSIQVGYLQKRAAVVFDLAYRRFLDLQKAEAQTREAQIEAALEKVRSRSLAMHKSDELQEVVNTVFERLTELNIEMDSANIAIFQEGKKDFDFWIASHFQKKAISFHIAEAWSFPIIQELINARENKQDFFSRSFSFEEKNDWFNYAFENTDFKNITIERRKYILESKAYALSIAFSKHTGVQINNYSGKLPSEAEIEILKRFSKVFEQAYIRFLDLQKAEAQAKEAQIEASLERVRSKTMAMHNSQDVGETVATMFDQLVKLGVTTNRCGILIFSNTNNTEVWTAKSNQNAEAALIIGHLDVTIHPMLNGVRNAWKNKEPFFSYELAGDDIKNYYSIINNYRDYPTRFNLDNLPSKEIHSDFFFPEGAVFAFTSEPVGEEHSKIFKRFAGVFGQTYRRYLDLQKAEVQAREATIEASLERVRGKAMAMHSSKDLATTIGVFYHELEGLNLTPRRCGVGLINKETKMAEISTMNAAADGQSIELVGVLDMTRHPVLTSVYNNWLAKTEYHPVLRGNEIKEYYQLVRPQVNFPDYPNDTVQYGYFFFFEEGGVYAWTDKELNEEELKIYRRFTSVLSLTYKRYKDLKDAEARTQAAVKDAALDRIRADIASMRTINDLDRITPLIWNELTVLGIPFIRCGVFIMDDEQELIHTFLSTPDGKAIAAFHLPYDTPGNLSQVLTNWKVNKNYIDRWDESEFKQFADILVKQGTLASAEQYLKTIPKGGFYLHFLPFLQGMLYVGNTTQLNNDEIELIQHVADAFSTAYARYEDFNKLEAAKQQVDKTLTDLKQAQTQLVQSEKMASLGELTAGIAHEIQNPLNFVNNFSDVSNELLEEMKIELEKGNKEDAIAIVEDVKQNLEKILHHGKRADAIVKGMLQHSRTSSGQKEPTDVNILADEYLRLAFHGLRAKDKSFNAKFETEFDNSIGKINIIPQDIGRVILNLINNAFYAVTEKKKTNTNGYEPVVTVTTKKDSGKIEIKVKDNGNGISQKVLDKIFQPFFTTKPTGQGTGLGLSLAYDIVTKGHGGELKVETREGEGSEFIIQLPVSKTTES